MGAVMVYLLGSDVAPGIQAAGVSGLLLDLALAAVFELTTARFREAED